MMSAAATWRKPCTARSLPCSSPEDSTCSSATVRGMSPTPTSGGAHRPARCAPSRGQLADGEGGGPLEQPAADDRGEVLGFGDRHGGAVALQPRGDIAAE